MSEKVERINVEEFMALIDQERREIKRKRSISLGSFHAQLREPRGFQGDPVDRNNNSELLQVSDRLISNYDALLEECNKAEVRLQEGVFGICESCEEEIPLERLRKIPFATICTPCSKEIVRKK